MRYTRLGRTGLAVSQIGMGTGDNAGLFVKAPRRELTEAVALAVELGLNYFDTSPDYGRGIAERNLGQIIRDLRIDPIISTKVEYYVPSLADFRTATLAGIDASLARLQRDHVDLLLVHNPVRLERVDSDFGAYWLPLTVEEVLGPVRAALQEVINAGKARFVGIATEGAQPAAVEQVLRSGLYDTVNVWYNVSNPSARRRYRGTPRNEHDYDGIIDLAEELDIGVSTIRPLAGGAITDLSLLGEQPSRHPFAGGGYSRNPSSFMKEAERSRFILDLARPAGLAPSEFAYRFLIADPAVHVIVGGFSDSQQIVDTSQWIEKGPLSTEHLEKLGAMV